MRRDCVKYGGVGVLVVWVACYVLFAAALYDDAGRWLMPWEVFTDGRLLMFMGIWSLLAFYCGYGLRKEFVRMRDATLAAFPDLAVVVKEVRREFTLKYLRLLFPLFCLLPFAYLAASSAMPPTITDYVVMGALLAMAIVLFILRKYMEKGRGGIFFTGSERQRSSVSWTKYVIWYGMVCGSAAVFLLPRPVGWGYIVWLVPVMLLVVFMQYVFTKR